MKTATEDQFKEISSSFSFTIEKDSFFHGFAIWFQISSPDLSNNNNNNNNNDNNNNNNGDGDSNKLNDEKEIKMSNSPFEPKTHWKQDLFLFGEGFPVRENQSYFSSIV